MTQIIALAFPFFIRKPPGVGGQLFLRISFLAFIVFLFLLLIFSVWQINEYSRAIFAIQNYQNNLNLASRENKTLEINFTKSNSLENFGNYLEVQPFEKASKIDYIRILDKVVTKAK